MPQIYPVPVSTTSGVTIVAGSGLAGGGTVPIGGSVTLFANSGPGGSRNAYTVTPSPNGITFTFTIVSAPFGLSLSYADVFLNGVLQSLGTNYSISGTAITFSSAPLTGDVIDVVFSNPPGARAQYTLSPVPNGATTSFSFPTDQPHSTYIDMYVNGILQTPGTNYALNLTAGTWAAVFTSAPLTGDILEAVFDTTQFVTRNLYALSPSPNGATTSFTITNGVPQNFYIDVYVNGVYQTTGVNYNLNLVGGVWNVVFTTAPLTGDTLEVVF